MQVIYNLVGPTLIGGMIGVLQGRTLFNQENGNVNRNQYKYAENRYKMYGGCLGAVSQLALGLFSEFGHRNRLASSILLLGSILSVNFYTKLNYPTKKELSIHLMISFMMNTILTTSIINIAAFSRKDMLFRAVGIK